MVGRDGAPLTDATVRLEPRDLPGATSFVTTLQTDADGHYRLEGLSSKRAILVAWKEGLQVVPEPGLRIDNGPFSIIMLAPDEQGRLPERLDIHMRGGGRIEGRVVDAGSGEGIAGARTGVYDPGRPRRLIDAWDDEQSFLFGEPVNSVREWADQAVASDDFLRNLATMFFQHAFERAPTPGEVPALDEAWAAMPGDGYSANGLLHRLVDLPAFGGVQ